MSGRGWIGAIMIAASMGLQAPAQLMRTGADRPKVSAVPAELAGITWRAEGTKGAVATGGAESAHVGVQVLKEGGTAVDAGVAVVLALGATDAYLFCFGGEVPILIHDPTTGASVSISGQGAAPRAATLEHFQQKLGKMPQEGPESPTVPAVLGACTRALRDHGTWTFARAAAPTLRILDRGEFPWHLDLAKTFRTLIAAEAAAGSDRVAGLDAVDAEFYRGKIAQAIDAWSRAQGGLLRLEDLQAHRTIVEPPVRATYRGHDVLKCGPWTQGPALLQTLRLLEGFDLKAEAAHSPRAVHLATEALKLGLADRDEYYADPLMVEVPMSALLSDEYTTMRRGLIDPMRASLELRPGDPIAKSAVKGSIRSRVERSDATPRDTTTCVVADAAGRIFAATPSGWDGPLVEGTGIWLGSRMQSFNAWQGHPNVVAPGKRPRITLTPTIVLRDGQPVMAASVAGGDLQDQTILQLLMNVIDFGMTPAEAVSAPRFGTAHHVGSFAHTPPKLGSVQLDARHADTLKPALEGMGHRVTISRGALAAPVLLRRDPETGQLEAAGDPLAKRHAAAW